MEAGEQLAHDGAQRLELLQAAPDELEVEHRQVRLVGGGTEGRHVQRHAQVAVVGLAEAWLLADAGARVVVARVEPVHRHPLAGGETLQRRTSWSPSNA